MIVYFNGFKMKLKDDNKIAQTKQVNSLFDLATRQTNFTNAIEFPKVGANIIAMEFLGITGNNSTVPYKINSVSMYSDTGECFIYNGRCVVLSTNETYKVQFLDGNIDLYKAIGNDKLGALNLPEIKHIRTVDNVIDSWREDFEKPYKYIVADFNGKTITEEGFLNADYLVPSVKASYLWDKIFTTYGFTYSGSFFQTNDFKKLWLTYPSGIELASSDFMELFKSADWSIKPPGNYGTRKGFFMSFNSFEVNEMETLGDISFSIPETSSYKIKISGSVKIREFLEDDNRRFYFSVGKNYVGSIDRGTHAENFSDLKKITPNLYSYGSDVDSELVIDLEQGDKLYIMFKCESKNWNFETFDIELSIEKINTDIIDFNKAYQDFGVKDFFNEIINRHALVPFKDKYSNNYKFETLDEVLNKKNAYDWSHKFPVSKGESYLYDSYKQRNYFRLKYDAKDVDYNDGFIEVNNKNLEDKTTSYSSPLYSPESTFNQILDKTTNVYKLWNKELKDDGTIDYKSIDKRFFFIAYELRNKTNFLKSEFNGDIQLFNYYPCESFKGLDFSSAVARFYRNSSVLLNKAVVKNFEIKLNDYDVANIDLSRQVFLKQEASYFLINKISNYISSKQVTTVELIKISGDIKQVISSEVINNISWIRYYVGIAHGARIFVTYDNTFFTTEKISLRIIDSNQYTNLDNDGLISLDLGYSFEGLTIRVQLFNEFAESEIKTITLN